MIMLTRSSEIIFNPMGYTSVIVAQVKLGLELDLSVIHEQSIFTKF